MQNQNTELFDNKYTVPDGEVVQATGVKVMWGKSKTDEKGVKELVFEKSLKEMHQFVFGFVEPDKKKTLDITCYYVSEKEYHIVTYVKDTTEKAPCIPFWWQIVGE